MSIGPQASTGIWAMDMAHTLQTSRDTWVRQGQRIRNGSAGVRYEGLCFQVSGLKYLTYLKIQGQQAWDSTFSIRR